jgi:dihydroorotase
MPQAGASTIQTDAFAQMHSHLREGEEVMEPLIDYAFQGGVDWLLTMGNTQQGLLSADQSAAYRRSCQRLVSAGRKMGFTPTIIINEQTPDYEIDRCADLGIFDGKVLPFERTTHAHYGVRRYIELREKIRRMAKRKMRLHLHPETPDPLIDDNEAEWQFISTVDWMLDDSDVTVIWEHGTDARCIPKWKDWASNYRKDGRSRFWLTLTAHHLATWSSRERGNTGSECNPPYKNRRDCEDLVRLVAEDLPWVMAGADDAPHDTSKKRKIGRCACGAYTAPYLAALYAHALNDLLLTERGLATFFNFTSRNARKLYNLPDASRMVTLVRQPFRIPDSYPVGPWTVEPFWAGKEIMWSISA